MENVLCGFATLLNNFVKPLLTINELIFRILLGYLQYEHFNYVFGLNALSYENIEVDSDIFYIVKYL